MDTPQILETLGDTPTWLRTGLAHLSDQDAHAAAHAGEWSLADILAHLRASDAILAPRVFYVLIRDQPPLIGFDERAWAVVAASAHVPLATQLDAFAALRAELLGILRTLDPPAWDRAGMHETRGRLTLRQIVSDLAEHEREHRAQWELTLAALGRPALPASETAARSRARRASPRSRRPADPP